MPRYHPKTAKDRKCAECGKKFDSRGLKYVVVCDECYETVPWTGNYCCYACKGKPRGYSCKNRRCECGQHADVNAFIMASPKGI
jgi:hypothetical protein